MRYVSFIMHYDCLWIHHWFAAWLELLGWKQERALGHTIHANLFINITVMHVIDMGIVLWWVLCQELDNDSLSSKEMISKHS